MVERNLAKVEVAGSKPVVRSEVAIPYSWPSVWLILDEYWLPDRPVRTEIGELVYRAKDCGDFDSAAGLVELFKTLATKINKNSNQLVAAVPSGSRNTDSHPYHGCASHSGGSCASHSDGCAVPSKSQNTDSHLSSMLAQGLAAAGAGIYVPDLVLRRNRMMRLRDVPPEQRPATVGEVGYEINESVAECPIVLVDDVLLTGSTIFEVSARLRDAGACEVVAAVAARTRKHH